MAAPVVGNMGRVCGPLSRVNYVNGSCQLWWVGDTAQVSVECPCSSSLLTCGLGEGCPNVAGFGDFWSRWIGDIQVASEATGAFF